MLAAILSAADARAQNAGDPRAWADKFFEVLSNDGEDDAFKIIKEETYLGGVLPGSIGALNDQMRQFKLLAGTTMDYEFVSDRHIGTRVIRLTYVVNNTNLPAIWELTMYNAQYGWQLVSINFIADTQRYPF